MRRKPEGALPAPPLPFEWERVRKALQEAQEGAYLPEGQGFTIREFMKEFGCSRSAAQRRITLSGKFAQIGWRKAGQARAPAFDLKKEGGKEK